MAGRMGSLVVLVVAACGAPPHAAPLAPNGVPPARARPTASAAAADQQAVPVAACASISLTDLPSSGSPFPGVVALEAKPTWIVLEGSRELLNPDPFESSSNEPTSLAFVLASGVGKLVRWDTGARLADVVADGAIVVSKSGCVQRVDLPSGQVRWTSRLEGSLNDDFVDHVTQRTFAYRNGSELGTLDLGSGAKTGDAALAQWLTSGELVADNGHTAFLEGSDSLTVVDLTSDRRIWAVDRKTSGADTTIAAALGASNVVLLQGRTPAHQDEHSCDGQLVGGGDPAWCQSRLVSLTVDGHVVKELSWSATRLGRGDAALVVDGDEVYVSMPDRVGGVDGRHVEALALPNLTSRWRTPAVPCGEAGLEVSPDSVTKIQLSKSSVFVCGCDGVLRRFARDTGKETGSFGVGMCHASIAVSNDTAVVRMTKGTAKNGEVTWNPWSTWCMDEPCIGQLLVIGAQAFTAPVATQPVTGKIDFDLECDLTDPNFAARGPFTVRIGDRVIQSAASGAFTAQIRQRGILSVDILSPERWEEQCALFADRPTTIAMDGKPHAPLAPNLRQFPEYVLGAGP